MIAAGIRAAARNIPLSSGVRVAIYGLTFLPNLAGNSALLLLDFAKARL